MRALKPILKPFSFLPALFMLYVIFQFSAQPGDASGDFSWRVTHRLLVIAEEHLELNWSESEILLHTEQLHPYMRKLAHVAEYFLLAVCVSFPLYVYRLRGLALTLLAGGFCVACACLDEYHQSFVAGRGPSRRDVLIDSIGILMGVILVRIVCFLGRMTIFRERRPRASRTSGR